MIARILAFLGFGIIIIIIALWFVRGGPSKVTAAAENQPNVVMRLLNGNLAADLLSFKLPWEGSVAGPGTMDISQYTGSGSATGYSQTDANQVRNIGTPSPYFGQVALEGAHATESDPAREYLSMQASRDNTSNIDITGWSVQSAVSGTRLYLPGAASIFIGGTVNTTGPVLLSPGSTAIVSSNVSPVGVSFRENICSGYLGKLQSFYPSLGLASCPNPSDALPETADNLRMYGSSCLDYVRSLSACTLPQDIPSTLSGTCRAFVQNTFSYNGCVQMHQGESTFLLNTWRLYLNGQTNLWDDSHDIIRLLDAQGRTVDAVTY